MDRQYVGIDFHRRRSVIVRTVSIARKILTLVYYGLRDGEIRCLAKTA
jgi:hypothetical protein